MKEKWCEVHEKRCLSLLDGLCPDCYMASLLMAK